MNRSLFGIAVILIVAGLANATDRQNATVRAIGSDPAESAGPFIIIFVALPITAILLLLFEHHNLWMPNRLVFLLAVTGFLIRSLLTPEIAMLDRTAGLFAGFLSLEIVRQVYGYFRKREEIPNCLRRWQPG